MDIYFIVAEYHSMLLNNTKKRPLGKSCLFKGFERVLSKEKE